MRPLLATVKSLKSSHLKYMLTRFNKIAIQKKNPSGQESHWLIEIPTITHLCDIC